MSDNKNKNKFVEPESISQAHNRTLKGTIKFNSFVMFAVDHGSFINCGTKHFACAANVC
jgi:hypothetical protein